MFRRESTEGNCDFFVFTGRISHFLWLTDEICGAIVDEIHLFRCSQKVKFMFGESSILGRGCTRCFVVRGVADEKEEGEESDQSSEK